MLKQEVFPAIRRKRSESQRETTTRRIRSKPNEPMEISEETPETIINNNSTPRRKIQEDHQFWIILNYTIFGTIL